MKAYVRISDIVCQQLIEISMEEMSSVLDDEVKGSLRGIPLYFDAKERVWPKPDRADLTIEFYDK